MYARHQLPSLPPQIRAGIALDCGVRRRPSLAGLEAVPDIKLIDWSFRLFALMSLAWDYIDTICDLCIIMQTSETKPLVREIRRLKRAYDQFRSFSFDKAHFDRESEHAMRFEEAVNDDLRKLCDGLTNEIGKLGLTREHRDLVQATQQALTLMDAVKLYARWCDSKIREYGALAPDCCMVQNEFLALYPLIPQFAGDCYKADIEARKLTAKILVNRLRSLPIKDLLSEDEIVVVKA